MMSDENFKDTAPQFWRRKLPIVPIEPGTKRPPLEMKGWQGNLASLPNEQKQTKLVERYPNHGIGVLLGAPLDSGDALVAFDVDDDRLNKLALNLLGLNRSGAQAELAGKRGKKGMTIFARAPKALKSTVIKGAGGLGNIDFLASGKMTVMPPSIHPDTGKPYEVIGRSLLDVNFNDLPEIAERHVKLLKAAVGSEHAIVLVEGIEGFASTSASHS